MNCKLLNYIMSSIKHEILLAQLILRNFGVDDKAKILCCCFGQSCCWGVLWRTVLLSTTCLIVKHPVSAGGLRDAGRRCAAAYDNSSHVMWHAAEQSPKRWVTNRASLCGTRQQTRRWEFSCMCGAEVSNLKEKHTPDICCHHVPAYPGTARRTPMLCKWQLKHG